MTTDEVLSAYIDGELPPEEMEEVRRAIEENASLADRVEALKSADRLVAHAYSGIDDAPMPQAVLDLLSKEDQGTDENSNVIPFTPRQQDGGRRHWAAALAATLALAVGLGLGMQLTPQTAPGAQGGGLIAGVFKKGDPVFAALENTPSSRTAALGAGSGVSVTPVVSFRSKSGEYCREFTMAAGDQRNRALACREDGQWAVKFAVAEAPRANDGATYSTASSHLNTAFDSYVDDMVADEPLAPADERAAIASGWTSRG